MMNVIDYDRWKISLENINDEDEIIKIVDQLNFKGYMSGVVGVDEEGKDLVVKTRAVNRLSELLNYDFSECYLYKIERINYMHYYTPEGTNPWDYDFVELSEFDKEEKFSYKIRYANKERKAENNEMA